MSDAESFWEPQVAGDMYHPEFAPASAARISEWEKQHSFRLPTSLSEALTVHNGGWVRGTQVWIEPIDDFSMLADPRWDDHFAPGNQDEFEGVDRGKLLLIGDSCGCGIVLDYSSSSEPTVLLMHHNLGGELRDEGLGTFDEFVERARD